MEGRSKQTQLPQAAGDSSRKLRPSRSINFRLVHICETKLNWTNLQMREKLQLFPQKQKKAPITSNLRKMFYFSISRLRVGFSCLISETKMWDSFIQFVAVEGRTFQGRDWALCKNLNCIKSTTPNEIYAEDERKTNLSICAFSWVGEVFSEDFWGGSEARVIVQKLSGSGSSACLRRRLCHGNEFLEASLGQMQKAL